ncbi:MAG: beta-lactamase family protein [Deltaproteobacteria bacterium]|nr:beta-lactamase family protein [Deltaproteobacteria bacterium]
MNPRFLRWVGASLVACASPPPPPPPPPPAPVAPKPEVSFVTGPAPVTTSAGAKLQVPAGFQAAVEGNIVRLEAPDRSVRTHLLELEDKDLERAIATAWRTIEAAPGKAESVVTPPGRDGWDAVRVETYALDASGNLAQAIARSASGRSWVALLAGRPADFDRRAAQLREFLGSLEVPGLEKVDLSTATPKPITPELSKLEQFIEETLEVTRTPGLELAIVEDGKIVLAKGYGIRELGKKDRVDADTLMMIGSVSKSMTTLLMAKLVDEGKMSWDQKASELLPGFKVGDEALSQKLSAKDLVCACAGLPRKDMPLVLEFEGKRPEHVFEELGGMRPSTGYRETFQYQNHMVAAAGFAAARLVEPKAKLIDAYRKSMQKHVFGPLGMTRTTLDHSAALKSKNRATPHSMSLDLEPFTVNLEHERFAEYVAPSGGIWSNANDMAKYLVAELNGGVALDGKRIASEENVMKRREKQVAIAADVHYGLGWVVAKGKGLESVSHNGGTMGFATLLTFIPSKKVGIFLIASSTRGHIANSVIRSRITELWFGIDDKAKEQLTAAIEAERSRLALLDPQLTPPDDAFMAPRLGSFMNAELGTITLAKDKMGTYILDAGIFKSKIKRHQRPDGRIGILATDSPLPGLELLTLPDTTDKLELEDQQERYLLDKAPSPR